MPTPRAFKALALGDDVLDIVEQHALGQLQLEIARVRAASGENGQHLVDEVRLPKLPGTDVDRNRETLPPRPGGPQCRLRAGAAVAEACELPMMVHIGIGPPAIDEVLSLMRPGDILTHCCTGHSMRVIDDVGALIAAAQRAWDAGVIMEVGHGAGSFSFNTAEAMARAGRWPDVISSDIHQLSVRGPMFDLPTTLSKFLTLGMGLPDVIAAATSRPAAAMGLSGRVGSLAIGANVDIALFRLEQGSFSFDDGGDEFYICAYKG